MADAKNDNSHGVVLIERPTVDDDESDEVTNAKVQRIKELVAGGEYGYSTIARKVKTKTWWVRWVLENLLPDQFEEIQFAKMKRLGRPFNPTHVAAIKKCLTTQVQTVAEISKKTKIDSLEVQRIFRHLLPGQYTRKLEMKSTLPYAFAVADLMTDYLDVDDLGMTLTKAAKLAGAPAKLAHKIIRRGLPGWSSEEIAQRRRNRAKQLYLANPWRPYRTYAEICYLGPEDVYRAVEDLKGLPEGHITSTVALLEAAALPNVNPPQNPDPVTEAPNHESFYWLGLELAGV